VKNCALTVEDGMVEYVENLRMMIFLSGLGPQFFGRPVLCVLFHCCGYETACGSDQYSLPILFP
jgi:hypothetical protein